MLGGLGLGFRARRGLGLLEGVWGCAWVGAGQGTGIVVGGGIGIRGVGAGQGTGILVGGGVGIRGVGAVQGFEARHTGGTGVRQIWGAGASSALPGQGIWAEPPTLLQAVAVIHGVHWPLTAPMAPALVTVAQEPVPAGPTLWARAVIAAHPTSGAWGGQGAVSPVAATPHMPCTLPVTQ